MFVNRILTYLTYTYLKNLNGVAMWNVIYYFHMKTKILEDFQIYISVNLIQQYILFINRFSVICWFLKNSHIGQIQIFDSGLFRTR